MTRIIQGRGAGGVRGIGVEKSVRGGEGGGSWIGEPPNINFGFNNDKVHT